jgi:lipopolysaccharide biosynthesis regulator YciM
MPAWLIPALKAALPHIGTIISAAAPVFTRKNADAVAITELQSAASQNAAHIKELAAELQSTVAALEQAASIAEAKLRRALWLCAASVVLSAISVGIALVFIFGR